MAHTTSIDEIAERVERLLQRHAELQRANTLLTQQVTELTRERDSLRSRLSAARARRCPARPPAPCHRREGRPMKQIEVRILQQSYLLVCPEGHEPRLMAAVDRVDAAMTRIRDAGKVRARERIAVLAAVNMAFELGDREAADQAAANERPPAPGQGTLALDDAQAGIPGASGQAPEHAAQQQERLQSLLQRLDAALHGAQQPA